MTNGNAMQNFQFWPSLEAAWKDTENRELVSLEAAVRAAPTNRNDWQLVKRESRVRLIFLGPQAPRRQSICKIYRVPGHLAWRTLGLVSRANREFTALMEAHRHGLPVVCPHYWSETRRLGCLTYSAISTELIMGSNLEVVLKDRNTDAQQRLRLARETGGMLRRLHVAGMFWATAYPRNVLVREDASVCLLVIDTPYAQWRGRDLMGSQSALTDLCAIVQSSYDDHEWGFGGQEQWELLLAYCADDHGQAAVLNAVVAARSSRKSKLERLRRRSANVLLSSPRSAGSGGYYQSSDKRYYQNDTQAVYVD